MREPTGNRGGIWRDIRNLGLRESVMEPRICGKDATHVAIEASKRRPVRIEAPEPGTSNEVPAISDATTPVCRVVALSAVFAIQLTSAAAGSGQAHRATSVAIDPQLPSRALAGCKIAFMPADGRPFSWISCRQETNGPERWASIPSAYRPLKQPGEMVFAIATSLSELGPTFDDFRHGTASAERVHRPWPARAFS
jgi:hypothetical protein